LGLRGIGPAMFPAHIPQQFFRATLYFASEKPAYNTVFFPQHRAVKRFTLY
jgi:hypothetical protein